MSTLTPKLRRALVALAADRAIADWFDLARHQLAHTEDYGTHSPVICDTIVMALRFEPNSIAAWHKMASWTLFVSDWIRQARPLTDDEKRMESIASRLWDATRPDTLGGPRPGVSQ